MIGGEKTLRREGRDRAVLPGPPQHDDEDKGYARKTAPDIRKDHL